MSINFFDHRQTIAKNLIAFLRFKGYSKLSFSKLTGISRPTIDQILKGESPSPAIYNSQLTKINQAFDFSEDYLVKAQATPIPSPPPTYAYSDRRVGEKSPQAQELLEGLDNILDIYSMYV